MAIEKLHPSAKWLFFLRNSISILIILTILFGWSLPFMATGMWQRSLGYLIGLPILIILALIFNYIFAILAYNNWSYEFKKEGVRIHRGIIWKHYSSIPYERIQNVDIHRGILARIFGFSTLMIQTAGYSGAGRRAGRFSSAEGSLPAVEETKAEKIREWLLKVISKR